jgi:hypothetical protein
MKKKEVTVAVIKSKKMTHVIVAEKRPKKKKLVE